MAVDDEMGNMVKFISLAFAETGKYVRLQDFDNTSELALTEDEMHPRERSALVRFRQYGSRLHPTHREPARRSGEAVERTVHAVPEREEVRDHRRHEDRHILGQDAHLWHEQRARLPWPATDEDADDRYPLDPWGNPYFYFPPETQWKTTLIFSMGPDGLPGSETAPDDTDYYPEERTRASANPGLLGTSDDIRWEF